MIWKFEKLLICNFKSVLYLKRLQRPIDNGTL